MDKPFPAYEGDEPYLFVCYAHDDAGIVYPEMRWLHECGLNIWYDEGISPGAEFPEFIGNAMLGSSLVLFYVSPRSAQSRHCRNEVFFGLDRGIPVLAAHLAETELPPGLALSTGTSQALLRYAMPLDEYRRKLLSGIASLSRESAAIDTSAAMQELRSLRYRLGRLAVPIGIAATVAMLGAGGYLAKSYLDRQAEIRWARDEALPQIRSMVDSRWSDFTKSYALAVEAEAVIPEDPELNAILDAISLRIDVESQPPGARVAMKPYAEPEAEWTEIGVTPLDDVRVPVGIFRWRFEKDGYEPVMAAASSWDIGLSGNNPLIPNHLARKLDPPAELPDDMVRVAGVETELGPVADFFIDRFEVTNAEYQRFVNAGAYSDRKYWLHAFVADGKVLSFEEAMARFIDGTGRPGPSSWLGGVYPDGLDNHPVSGVSWYEAAAYAEFVGRDLPTGTHWGVARGEYSPLIRWPQLGGLAVFTPFSNFGGRGTTEVGSQPGITAFGAYDQAGNVREWCSNDTVNGKLLRGGAWYDNPYRFGEPGHAPPMQRDPGFGLRTVLYPDGGGEPAAAFAAVPIRPAPDYYGAEIVDDEVFAVFRRQFDYDNVPLNARRESVDDSAELWTLERVSIDTPYNSDRMVVNLFLPKNVSPPYQTVIYFPGSAALFQESSENLDEYYEFPVFLSFLVKTGRAVAFPVYEGTFERRDDRLTALHLGKDSVAYSEFLAHLVKDLRRSIDYLETREDIDAERLAYYGMSWGAILGTIIPAVETRLKTSMLLAGGLYSTGRPEADPINYVTRITMPYLMLVGRYDSILGHEAAAKPLFDLISTPDEHKLMKVYETDHIPPKSEYIAEILSWLDSYLGPVGAVRTVAKARPARGPANR